MMEDKEIEVGKEYVVIATGLKYKLLYVDVSDVVVGSSNYKMLITLDHFKEHYSPVPIKRKKVELFQTCARNGDIRLCDSFGRYFDQTCNKWYTCYAYKQNRSEPPVAYLYTDDFSIEWIVDKE